LANPGPSQPGGIAMATSKSQRASKGCLKKEEEKRRDSSTAQEIVGGRIARLLDDCFVKSDG
jgi:hypothetical protein